MSQRYIGGLIYNPPGGFSGYFDGSGDYLSAPSNAAFSPGTGDFTVECWANLSATTSEGTLFYVNATNGINLFLSISGNWGIARAGVAVDNNFGTPPSFNTWNHLAVSRSGSTIRAFINGNQVFSGSNTSNYAQGAALIGSSNGFGTVTGYISNFRFVKGTAVYTAAFTPPVGPLQAITNTSLLTCAYGTFRDGSTNNFTITVNGNTAVSTQNPFPQTQLPNPALGNQGNGIYSMSQYQSLLQQNLWPAVDPYWEYVTLMLHGNGTNGAQNNTFLDSSTNNFTITRNGNTTQGTFTPYGSNWSNYFDGSSSVSIADAASLEVGSGDFTVDCFVNFSTLPSTSGVYSIVSKYNGASNQSWILYLYNNAGSYEFRFAYSTSGSGAAGDRIFAYTPSVGVWYQVTVTRSGSNLILYVNGSQVGTTQTISGTLYNGNAALQVNGASGFSYNFSGYVSNVRLVVGTAVTPPSGGYTTPLTAVTNTQALLCQSNRFIDNSSNNFTITRNGDVSVQRFSPFNPTASYAADTVGGSGVFDAVGDTLETPTNSAFNLGTGAFQIDFWMYPTGSPGQFMGPFGTNNNGGTGGIFFANRSGNLDFVSNNDNITLIRTTYPSLNNWHHVVLVRNSSGLRAFFLDGVRVGTASDAADFNQTKFFLGAYNASFGGWPGYLSNFRIIKGSNIADPNSTTVAVPTAPTTAVAGTQFLANFTNGGIIDNAMMNNLETVGNAQISTSVSKFGGGSMAFDGSGDYLTLANLLNTNLGSGPFTIELWAYFNSASGTQFILSNYQNSTIGYGLGLSSGVISFWATGDTPDISSGLTPSTGVWYHIAVSGQSGSIKLFINGTQYGSTFTGTPALDSTLTLRIGDGQGAASPQAFNGYIDDLRITKGYARYTVNFTPQRSQWQDQ